MKRTIKTIYRLTEEDKKYIKLKYMEYFSGISLSDYLKKYGEKISFAEAEWILFPIIDALSSLCEKGIIHGSVCPDNIFIAADGTIKLIDFCESRYGYVNKTHNPDVYSIAATFYRVITGHIPPNPTDQIKGEGLITHDVNIIPEVEKVLFKALEVIPTDRFESMSDFKAALMACEIPAEIPVGIYDMTQSTYESNNDYVLEVKEEESSITGSAGEKIEKSGDSVASTKKDSVENKKKHINRIFQYSIAALVVVIISIVVSQTIFGNSVQTERNITETSPDEDIVEVTSISQSNIEVPITGQDSDQNSLQSYISRQSSTISSNSSLNQDFTQNPQVEQSPALNQTNKQIISTNQDSSPSQISNEQPYSSSNSEYKYTVSNNKVTIDKYVGNDLIVEIPSMIDGNPVTTIGVEAFYRLTDIESIEIPDSVTAIGDFAFAYCSTLQSINLPNNITLIGCSFQGCSSLKNITIPDGITSIEKWTFSGCSSLESITIPNSVTSIGDGAFGDCSSLTSITIPDSVTSVGDDAFSGCSSLTNIIIPDNVTSIGYGTFGDCSSLTSITIPGSVTSIGGFAFCGCSSLESITIPDSVTSIVNDTFLNCSSLINITIPDSVTSVGDDAFSGCSSLTNITIPDSVTLIGDNTFYGCLNLEKIYIKGKSSQPDSWSDMWLSNCPAEVTWET